LALLQRILFAGLALVVASLPVSAQQTPALVFEPATGLVLYSEHPDLRWHPASLTKLMTAYLTFEAIKAGRLSLDGELSCSAHANAQVPTKIGLPVGAKMRVGLGLETLIVKSANDVAVMLGEGVGDGLLTRKQREVCTAHTLATEPALVESGGCRTKGPNAGKLCAAKRGNSKRAAAKGAADPAASEAAGGEPASKPEDLRQKRVDAALAKCRLSAFIGQMNITAHRLGMTRSRFVNPNGLPDDRQVTTARDMALLTRAIIDDYPEHAALFSLPSVKVGKRRLRSHNGLLRTFQGADGMKTGFICASGFNIVASATRNRRRLVAVVLGLPTSSQRNERTKQLLEYGYAMYGWKAVFPNGSIEALPFSPRVDVAPTDIRRKVRSRACGYWPKRRHKARKKAKKRKRKTARVQKSRKSRKKRVSRKKRTSRKKRKWRK